MLQQLFDEPWRGKLRASFIKIQKSTKILTIEASGHRAFAVVSVGASVLECPVCVLQRNTKRRSNVTEDVYGQQVGMVPFTHSCKL